MNDLVWPFLTKRFLQPYTPVKRFAIVADENDRGAPNVRLLSTKPRELFSCRAMFSRKKDASTGKSEWDIFNEFVNFTIVGGTQPFKIPDPFNFDPDDEDTFITVRFVVEEMNNNVYSSITDNTTSHVIIETTLERM